MIDAIIKLLKNILSFITDISLGILAYIFCLTAALFITTPFDKAFGVNLEIPVTMVIGLLASYLFWNTKRFGEGLLNMSFFIILSRIIELIIGPEIEFIYKLLLEFLLFIPIYLLIINPIKRFFNNIHENKILKRKIIKPQSLKYEV